MKRIDLKAFRKANNLTQEQLGDYLGIKKSFVSTIESGKDPMPKAKLSKLLNNPYNWDVSMLIQSENPPTEEPKDSTLDFVIRHMASQIDELSAKYKSLESEYKELRDERDKLLVSNRNLQYMLDLARKGEIARTVVGSSDADAV